MQMSSFPFKEHSVPITKPGHDSWFSRGKMARLVGTFLISLLNHATLVGLIIQLARV